MSINKTAIYYLLVITYACSNSSSIKSNYQNEHKSIYDFIPENYSLLDSAEGDLNLDNFPDIILILKKVNEDSTSSSDIPEKRPLLILSGSEKQYYNLESRNDNIVYCVTCGGIMGDPYMDVQIENGSFTVSHYGGSALRWTRTSRFKYSPSIKHWILQSDSTESFHATDPEKVEVTINSQENLGKLRVDKYDVYK